jgi:multiple sugar transport system substrate-binding protein
MTESRAMWPSGASRRQFLAGGSAAAAAAFLAACSGGSSGTSGSGGGTPSLDSNALAAELAKPAELTFWTWVPDIASEVALFEKKYPNIKVKVVNAGQGLDEYTKLRTALKAGTGAPDVVQIEYSYIPTFTITKNLLDLAPYGANALKADFVDWSWNQVSDGDKVYAIPQDTGPLGMLYRKDIFDKYGITVPTTWAEFATAAQTLHEKNPKISMTNFASNDAGQTFGYAWQAGARPFALDGTSLTLDVAGPAMKKLADFWSPLVASGAVSTDPDFNNDWYAGLSNGSYATWITAAWAPVFLQSSAAKSAGKWRVAPIPQWTSGDHVSGNWGGSTSAVTTQTKYPAAAAAFAMFLNHDPASSLLMATKQFLFPPLKQTLTDPTFVGQTPAFYGGQKVNALFAEISKTVSVDFQWSPFNDYVTSTNNQIFGGALLKKAPLSAALDTWQSTLTSYAKQQGFAVKG